MAKKEEVPDYIAKHKKLYSHATRLTDTASHTHSEAYTSAVNKHLMVNGQVDFDKLDDNKVQLDFVKTMSDMYVSKAKQHFKVSKDLNELEEDLLMQAYVGVTNQQLKEQVSKYGKRFTHAQFDNIKQQLHENIGKRLYASAASHLEEENIPEIVKHIGLESKIDANRITLEEATGLLEVFNREGSVSDSALRQHVATYKVKKKKAS